MGVTDGRVLGDNSRAMQQIRRAMQGLIKESGAEALQSQHMAKEMKKCSKPLKLASKEGFDGGGLKEIKT